MSTRSVRFSRCRRCSAATLTGFSDDWLAWTAEVDPAPLSPVGEAYARLAGRRTYALRRHVGRARRLYLRDRWQIRGTPAGVRRVLRFDVVADHVCGEPLPATASQLVSSVPLEEVSDVCPF